MSTDCPAGIPWCAGGHRCQPLLREHRSDPWACPSEYGTLVATRVRRGTRDWVEIRASIDLPRDELRARDLARLLVLGVDLTIRSVLAGRLDRVRRAYQRLTGVEVR